MLLASLAGVGCARRSPREAEVEKLAAAIGAPRPLGEPRTPGVFVVPATGEARDVAVAAGSVWVVAPGALVEYPTGGAPRVVGWSEGLGTTAPTAVASAGDVVVAGGADGSLTVVEGGRSQIVRLGGGPIVDLAADAHTVYAATHGGLFVWPIGAPAAIRALAGADVTAIALGPSGLAAGLGDGSLALVGETGSAQT